MIRTHYNNPASNSSSRNNEKYLRSHEYKNNNNSL